MREIKFKAQRVDNGEWVFGSLMIHGSYCYILPDNPVTPFGILKYRVIPETVCQFTGLKDKNGVEIYEGDKFQYHKHEGYILPDFTGEILFRDGCFGYVPTSSNMGERFHPFSEIDELEHDFLNHIEIVDNIHDKQQRKQALIDMMRGDEELGLYDDNPKNHGYER